MQGLGEEPGRRLSDTAHGERERGARAPRSTLAYRVYWQPGCTSCLKAKEFLTRHGIDFESVNVRESATARAELESLGARSIPVIVRGDRWTYAQDLQTVARFTGVQVDEARLAPAALAARLGALLDYAARTARALPADTLARPLPGRAERAGADLAFHVAMIVAGLLDAAEGGELTYAHFERRPAADARTAAALAATLAEARARFDAWWTAHGAQPPAQLATYYGLQDFHGVLERTAWHVAQHCRQLGSLATAHAGPAALPHPDLLQGLPVPDGIWDRETGAPA